jgi:trehalose 6-phosphate phosphatase
VDGHRAPPTPERGWAYFLDVDGTLVELAPAPDAVHVAPATLDLVHRVHAETDGALALITGRSIHDVDRLFAGSPLPIAGQHGLERRDGGGLWSVSNVDADGLALARRRLAMMADRFDGVLVEDKGRSLALHYRAAPHLEADAVDAVQRIGAELGADYVVQTGKCVVELRPAGTDKGEAIRAFMDETPFRGRTPVFIGDDTTDEHGFAVVNEMEGYSVKVGEGPTCARWWLSDVRAVERWLERISAG